MRGSLLLYNMYLVVLYHKRGGDGKIKAFPQGGGKVAELARSDEGRVCRCRPFVGCRDKAAPHPSAVGAADTFPRWGMAPLLCRGRRPRRPAEGSSPLPTYHTRPGRARPVPTAVSTKKTGRPVGQPVTMYFIPPSYRRPCTDRRSSYKRRGRPSWRSA